jgi:Apea-like HEPN
VSTTNVQSVWPPNQLHEKAKDAFNKRGADLASKIVKRERQLTREDAFPSRQEPYLTIRLDSTPDDWVDEITDFCGRTNGRYYLHEGCEFALVDAAYKNLRSLAGDVMQKSPFQFGFSSKFIETHIFKWLKLSLLGKNSNLMMEHLTYECSKSFGVHKLLVPLDFIEIEHDFSLGDVMVMTIPEWLIDLTEKHAEEQRVVSEGRRDYYANVRNKFANRAAVEVTVWGEPEYGREIALETAFDMAGVLRYLSPASVSSVLPSLIQPMGYGHIPHLTVLSIADGRIKTLTSNFLHYGLARWQQPHEYLDRAMNTRLDNLSVFFDGSTLSNFANRFRDAFRVYTRAIGRFEPQDRIVGVISALECLFVAGSRDPLAHTVSERMAFLIAKEGTERKRIVTTYKKAYALRSQIVHHSAKFKDEEVANALFRDACVAFHRAIEGISFFKTHESFLVAIDDEKFGVAFQSQSSK